MSKRTRKSEQARREKSGLLQSVARRRVVAGVILTIVLVVAGGAAIILLNRPAASDEAAAIPYTVGNVTYCLGQRPEFVTELGFTQGLALDTRGNRVKGVVMREYDQSGAFLNSYQDPSWSSAGYLGAYAFDRDANIYIIPAPFVSILDNPPTKANIIYRIDQQTGVMAPYLDLPSVADLTPEMVYGLTDIVYDCDSNMLYASSIMGSTEEHQRGRIFQIDVSSGEITYILDGIDAFSLGVFNTSAGKKLYVGLARIPEIYAFPLDEKSHVAGDMRPEISLVDKGLDRDDRAQSLTFQGQDRLLVKTLPFHFNLVAPTEHTQTVYEYHYDAGQDSWQQTAVYVTDA